MRQRQSATMELLSLVFLLCCSICVTSAWWMSSNNGVTAAKLISTARKYDGKSDWSKAGCKHGSKFCGKYKCNLYVHDMLVMVKAKVPERHWWTYSPIGANEWGNSRSTYILNTKCYVNVNSPRPGDIVAFPANQGSGHVGIMTTYGGNYISAGDYIVEEKRVPSGRSKTYWRYQYSKKDC